MPPFEMPNDAGYWGYNTLNFFSPELSYSSKRQFAEVIDEFKWMVQELHKRNIEVLIDVVYHHSGEGGLWRQKVYERLGQRPSNLDPEDVGGSSAKVAATAPSAATTLPSLTAEDLKELEELNLTAEDIAQAGASAGKK